MGDSISDDIDQYDLLNESFKVRVKNHPEATAKDICNHLKPEIRNKPNVVVIYAGGNDLTSNTKLVEN